MLTPNEQTRSPRVVVAEDNAQVMRKIVELLRPICQVVETVPNGLQALDAVAAFEPDIALLDISMPGMNGIEVVRRLRSLPSRTKVMIVTVYEDADFVAAAFAAGASAYVVKSRLANDLPLAVLAVTKGEVFTSPFAMCASR